MMKQINSTARSLRFFSTIAISAAIGMAIGAAGNGTLAQVSPPTEHIGISVDPLGTVSEESLKSQIGLEGYILQMRLVTLAPGGQVARHDHAKKPGLVRMISGQWIEGTEAGEETFSPDKPTVIIEHKDVDHWVYNRTDESTVALVCGLSPAS